MGLNQEYTQAAAVATDCATSTESAETLNKLNEMCRDKAWSLYYWVRLFLSYGEQYRPDLEKIVKEIQQVQDQMSGGLR